MTYEEAIKQSLETKWVLGTCSSGEECWCRTIKCDPPLMFEEWGEEEEYLPVEQGHLTKLMAERFVYLHNSHLKMLEINSHIEKYFKRLENEFRLR